MNEEAIPVTSLATKYDDVSALVAGLAPRTEIVTRPLGQFVPTLALAQGSMELITLGKVGVGEFFVNLDKDNLVVVGKSFNAFVLGFNYKAIIYGETQTRYSYDRLSPLFSEAQTIEAEHKAQNKTSPAKFGYEALLYIPELGRAVVHFFNNITGRNFVETEGGISTKIGSFVKIQSSPAKKDNRTWIAYSFEELPKIEPSREDLDNMTTAVNIFRSHTGSGVHNKTDEATAPPVRSR